MGGTSIGFYLPWQIKGEQATTAGIGAVADDHTGFFPLITASMGHMGGRVGYDYAEVDNGVAGAAKQKNKDWVVGLWYSVAQNVDIDVEYTNEKVDNLGFISGDSRKLNAFTLVLDYNY